MTRVAAGLKLAGRFPIGRSCTAASSAASGGVRAGRSCSGQFIAGVSACEEGKGQWAIPLLSP